MGARVVTRRRCRSRPGRAPIGFGALAGQNYCQRLRSFRPDTHMKPWIIAALICSAYAAYAAEDDNKIHPTCVEENNTRRCWVDHGPPTAVRPPQLQPVTPAPQAAIPPPAPAMVPFPPPPRWWPPPLIFRFGPYGLTVPRRCPALRPSTGLLNRARLHTVGWRSPAGRSCISVNTKNRSHGQC